MSYAWNELVREVRALDRDAASKLNRLSPVEIQCGMSELCAAMGGIRAMKVPNFDLLEAAVIKVAQTRQTPMDSAMVAKMRECNAEKKKVIWAYLKEVMLE